MAWIPLLASSSVTGVLVLVLRNAALARYSAGPGEMVPELGVAALVCVGLIAVPASTAFRLPGNWLAWTGESMRAFVAGFVVYVLMLLATVYGLALLAPAVANGLEQINATYCGARVVIPVEPIVVTSGVLGMHLRFVARSWKCGLFIVVGPVVAVIALLALVMSVQPSYDALAYAMGGGNFPVVRVTADTRQQVDVTGVDEFLELGSSSAGTWLGYEVGGTRRVVLMPASIGTPIRVRNCHRTSLDTVSDDVGGATLASLERAARLLLDRLHK